MTATGRGRVTAFAIQDSTTRPLTDRDSPGLVGHPFLPRGAKQIVTTMAAPCRRAVRPRERQGERMRGRRRSSRPEASQRRPRSQRHQLGLPANWCRPARHDGYRELRTSVVQVMPTPWRQTGRRLTALPEDGPRSLAAGVVSERKVGARRGGRPRECPLRSGSRCRTRGGAGPGRRVGGSDACARTFACHSQTRLRS
jgi:hypothetical protein